MLVDIGANIGMVTLTWANRFPQARIHAYEPHPRTYRTLEMNVSQNALGDRVETFREAVGRRPGHLALSSPSLSVLATAYASAATAAIRVLCVDVNEVARRAGRRIDVLKIDAEGAEADILEGASSDSLAAVREVVLEYHDGLVPGARQRCARILEAAGFQLRIQPANADQGLLYAWRGNS
jgi:FkbM family methyltransferase